MLPASRDGTDSPGPPGSVSRYGGRDLMSDRPSGRPALFEPSTVLERGRASSTPPPSALGRSGLTLAQPVLLRTGKPSTTMGDLLSISICNERGLRALLREFRNPVMPVASPPADASRSEEPKSPSSRSHPRPFPDVRSKRFGPLRPPTVRATRRADCSSLCEAERFHPEAVERTRPLLTYR